MAPPSPLTIATQVVVRLTKEEQYYHKDQASQEARIKRLEDGDYKDIDEQNAEFVLKQEKTVLAETKAMFEPVQKKIDEAVQKLEEQIALAESAGSASEEELKKAKHVLETVPKKGD